MPVTTVTSREFNQDSGRAKKAAEKGPVFITDRGQPSHVLLSIDDYRRLTGSQVKIADLLSHEASADVELPMVRRTDRARPAKLG
jgi:prevent-host-death family protein